MPTYNPYYILLTETAKSDEVTINEYDKILKSTPSKYNNLNLPSKARSQTGSFPTRIVTASFTSSFDRVGLYHFSDAETASLKNDTYIKALIKAPYSSSLYIHASGSPETSERGFLNYRLQTWGFTQNTKRGWDTLPISKQKELGNWNIWFHSLPSESRYVNYTDEYGTSSLYGSNTWMTMSGDFTTGSTWGYHPVFNPDGTAQRVYENQPDHQNYTNVGAAVSGKNVDILICEGERTLYNSATSYNAKIEYQHIDFFSLEDKNTRVQFIDWRDYGDTLLDPMYYFPAIRGFNDYHNPNQTISTNHRQMCASTAAGLLNGFGYSSDIYFYPASTVSYDTNTGWVWPYHLNVIKTFHLNKPINPKTGRKNPTVVNVSMRGHYQFPYYLYELGSSCSSSFTIPLETNKGFRIAHHTHDYIFEYSTTETGNLETPQINNFNVGSGIVRCGYLTYYSSSIDLKNKINTYAKEFFTCSVSSNILHITTSTEYVPLRPKIYTGSNHDFYNVDNYPGPRGGEFIAEFSGGFDPDTHIHRIVVKNQEILTGSSLFPNAKHGPPFQGKFPYDQYGIERPLALNAIRLRSGSESYAYEENGLSNPSGTGIRWKSGANICQSLSSIIPPNNEENPITLIHTLYEELADAGVIMVLAAGNDGHLTTIASSSNMKYFDENLYDEDLYNTWLQYDCKHINNFEFVEGIAGADINFLSYVEPDDPVRFGGPSQISNGAAIIVGALGSNLDKDGWNTYIGEGIGANNGTGATNQQLSKQLTCGIFPAEYSQKGSAIDAYCAGYETSFAAHHRAAGPSYIEPGALESHTLTHSIYERLFPDGVNTQSLVDAYNQPHNNRDWYYRNPLHRNGQFYAYYVTESSSPDPNMPEFSIYGHQTNTCNGGTSNAAPRMAGMIACYLEVNPDATLKDVRNWIRGNSYSIPTGNDPSKNYYMFNNYWGYVDNPSIESSSYEPTVFLEGGEFGPDPRIMSFPYAQKNPSKFEGNVALDNINFNLD